MSELACNQCGVIGEPHTEQIPLAAGGFHLKASCADCGAYIKFLPHSAPSIFFGKYKGKTVTEIAVSDPEYLRWLARQEWCKPKLKTAIDELLGATR